MPMSQHRPALAAILVAFVAVLTAGLSAHTATAAPAPAPGSIASVALSYDGTWQGECWIFAKKVVAEATGHQMGFDYRQGYFDAGAVEVKPANAQPGDVIQVADDNNTSPDASYNGLHTSIVIDNLGDGTFNVVDSNRDFDGIVHQRAGYDPAASAARFGLEYHIYRITGEPSVAPSLRPKLVPGGKFLAGGKAITVTPGDVLNLRDAPNGSRLGSLPDGTHVNITADPVSAGGRQWAQVNSLAGSGWVATDFLAADNAADTSAAGSPATTSNSTKPVLQRRTFVAISAGD
jgi:Bacterial SH3 domain